MAKLSKTQVTYNGESFELGSEEARIIYTALKALNDGTAQTDGVGLSTSAYETGSGATSFLCDTFTSATANKLYLTASSAFTILASGDNAVTGLTGSSDYFVMLKK